MAYYKCKECGTEFQNFSLAKFATSLNCPKCNALTEYSASDEEIWYNQKDENGELIRPRFSGADEMDARQKAADYFKCDPRDVPYFIVQRKGLFKPFVICASKPIVYENDPDAVQIVMWSYEGKPKTWARINTKKQTILYPYYSINEPKHYTKIYEFKEEFDSTFKRNVIRLVMEPDIDVKFDFLNDTIEEKREEKRKLINLLKDYITPIDYGFYIEVSMFDEAPTNRMLGGAQTIKGSKFTNYMTGVSFWKADNYFHIFWDSISLIRSVKLDRIKYYRLVGEAFVKTNVSGGGGTGGGSSLKGAVIGGLVAGGAGAIIGSRQEINIKEVKTTTSIEDNRYVLLYDKDSDEVIQFDYKTYEIFLKLIPELEYNTVMNETSFKATEAPLKDDQFEVLQKLSDLHIQGILSDSEFETKKQEILSRI